jgi:hypothetical protein
VVTRDADPIIAFHTELLLKRQRRNPLSIELAVEMCGLLFAKAAAAGAGGRRE